MGQSAGVSTLDMGVYIGSHGLSVVIITIPQSECN